MRIIIAEDSAILRDGLAQLLALRGHQVTTTVGDAAALHVAVAEDPPDVAVIDIRMPPTHTDEGLRAAIELRRQFPGLGVLLFSQYVETRFVGELLADGSSGVGYLLKERVVDIDDFIDALNRVASGGTALDPEVVTQLLGAGRRAEGIATLTPREREVLSLMAEGRTNAAIAKTFVVTDRAVEKHIANIFTKLGLTASDVDHRRVLAVLRYLDGR
jgi:DNA-binding NarL/FixJ family response regulator